MSDKPANFEKESSKTSMPICGSPSETSHEETIKAEKEKLFARAVESLALEVPFAREIPAPDFYD